MGSGRRKIAVIALDGAYPASLLAAIDVVDTLNRHLRQRKARTLPEASASHGTLSVQLLSLRAPQIITAGELRLAAQGSIDSCGERFDLVVLPAFTLEASGGWRERRPDWQRLFAWLRRQRAQGARFAAHGAGIVLLAQAGLLEGHQATIPIALEAPFRERFPDVELDMTRSIVSDRETICAAALADGVRLLWRAVQYFRPGVLSVQTAIDLFFHDHDRLEDTRAASPESGDPLIDGAQFLLNQWLSQNLSGSAQVAQLAQRLGVSARTLFRRFKAVTGLTPNVYVQRLRVETAKGLLRLTDVSIERVAARVGYSSKTYFSRLFRRATGFTPHAYRLHCRR